MPYSRPLAATGGATPLVWSISAGSLPAGLSLDAATGIISGTPTAAGTSDFTVQVADSWTPQDTDTQALSLAITTDNQPPVVTNVASLPTQVRFGIDTSITLTATADDTATGGMDIASVEYFIGADPGEGLGLSLDPADGAFDSPTESAILTIDSSGWARPGVTLHVRAEDSSGSWSAPVDLVIPVVDATAPGAVTDLVARPYQVYTPAAATVEEVSSELPGQPATNLVDGDTRTDWQTLGTVLEEVEHATIDLGSAKPVSAVAIVAGDKAITFPKAFDISVSADGVDWTAVATAVNFRAIARKRYVWEFAPVEIRYVKVSGPGMMLPADGRYYWQLGEIEVPMSTFASVTRLSWTAPADDGYAGDPVSGYDIRWSLVQPTEATFDACPSACGSCLPAAPGTKHNILVNLGDASGAVKIVLKSVDASGNWSAMSNVATATVGEARIWNTSPDDDTVLHADEPREFSFGVGPLIRPRLFTVSTLTGFPHYALVRPNGEKDSTTRFGVKRGSEHWLARPSQWKRLKDTACADGALHWRIEGRAKVNKRNAVVYGPRRSMYFDLGALSALTVDPSHDLAGDRALWPDAAVPPTFSWTDNTIGLPLYFVDVSPDPSFPAHGPAAAVTLGGADISGSTCTPTPVEWRKIRALAASGAGTLHWKVRALDSQKVLVCGSSAETLRIDPGDWTVTPLDLSAPSPTVSWTHSCAGIQAFSIQVSHAPAFPAGGTLKLPAVSISANNYSLAPSEKANLLNFARRYGVAQLHYRIRGEDADKAFLTFSPASTANLP